MTPRVLGIKVSPRSCQSIRRSAQAARQELWPEGGRINGAKLLERLIHYGVTYDVVPDSLILRLGGVEASFDPVGMTLFLTEKTYNNLVRGDGRALFTLSHELGHFLLHAGVKVLHRESSSRAGHKIYEDSEWQANAFAAEFCMPLDAILQLKERTAEAISLHFGVSLTAASVRREQLQKQGHLPAC
ncbi:ImmA/IrrE family metallo-endopeptidase [Comamonadaceae bacterium OH3737_COT-264]|nr:ImmA/IrrE family metallo-endopeptidase [Comamonadaceae bacterium OH3737_COT-264]